MHSAFITLTKASSKKKNPFLVKLIINLNWAQNPLRQFLISHSSPSILTLLSHFITTINFNMSFFPIKNSMGTEPSHLIRITTINFVISLSSPSNSPSISTDAPHFHHPHHQSQHLFLPHQTHHQTHWMQSSLISVSSPTINLNISNLISSPPPSHSSPSNSPSISIDAEPSPEPNMASRWLW